MLNTILTFSIFILTIGMNDDNLLLDFQKNNEVTKGWACINDGVMGGLSNGVATYKKNSLIFAGKISLENNGGFASMRSPFGQVDLSAYETVTIRYRAKGQSFAMMLEDDTRYYTPYFKKEFYTVDTHENKWNETTLELGTFEAYTFGRPLGTYLGTKNLKNIVRIGIITNSKETDPFELEVDYIKFE